MTTELRIHEVPQRVNRYLDRMAEEAGMSKHRLLHRVITDLAGHGARSVTVVESEGGVLYVRGREENVASWWLARVRYSERWPWLTDEEYGVVQAARAGMLPREGETARDALARTREFLREHGFTVYHTEE